MKLYKYYSYIDYQVARTPQAKFGNIFREISKLCKEQKVRSSYKALIKDTISKAFSLCQYLPYPDIKEYKGLFGYNIVQYMRLMHFRYNARIYIDMVDGTNDEEKILFIIFMLLLADIHNLNNYDIHLSIKEGDKYRSLELDNYMFISGLKKGDVKYTSYHKDIMINYSVREESTNINFSTLIHQIFKDSFLAAIYKVKLYNEFECFLKGEYSEQIDNITKDNLYGFVNKINNYSEPSKPILTFIDKRAIKPPEAKKVVEQAKQASQNEFYIKEQKKAICDYVKENLHIVNKKDTSIILQKLTVDFDKNETVYEVYIKADQLSIVNSSFLDQEILFDGKKFKKSEEVIELPADKTFPKVSLNNEDESDEN